MTVLHPGVELDRDGATVDLEAVLRYYGLKPTAENVARLRSRLSRDLEFEQVLRDAWRHRQEARS